MDKDGEARALSRDDLELARRWRAFLSGGEAPAAAGDTDADTALAAHIVVVWREIKARAHMYRCVESLAFLRASARRLPGYAALLARARDRGAAFRVLDVGCAFGQETRALILDGVPPSCCAVAEFDARVLGRRDGRVRRHSVGRLAAAEHRLGLWRLGRA